MSGNSQSKGNPPGGYNQFTNATPDKGTIRNSSVPSDKSEITIQQILDFAQKDAKAVWDELGLNGITLPKIKFGKTNAGLVAAPTPYAYTSLEDGTITLNKYYLRSEDKWSVSQFAQALFQELGNLKNISDLRDVAKNISKYQTADAFARALEEIEYRTVKVLLPHMFGPNAILVPPMWHSYPKTFEEFYSLPGLEEHKQAYRDTWYGRKR